MRSLFFFLLLLFPIKTFAASKEIVSWGKSENCLYEGTILNNLLRYQDAITILDEAIRLDYTNKEAYIERAYAYFELDDLEKAIADYHNAKRKPPYKLGACLIQGIDVRNDIEFARGLTHGVLKGAGESSLGFFPSIFGTLRGILHGLWAFVLSPQEISGEMVHAAYSMGNFLSSCNGEEFLEILIPEIGECAENWSDWQDREKGYKLGYIIGKYSIEILIPFAGSTAVRKYTALKRANAMSTLSPCTNPSKKRIILDESKKRANLRKITVAQARKGRVVPKNPNDIYHTMQPKHDWYKLTNLTGNTEADFNKVAKLLTEHKILDKKCFSKKSKFANATIAEHHVMIKKQKVIARFELDEPTGVYLLRNAWVAHE